MVKARIIIGANYGDEGKGTVVANYTKKSHGTVLNVLTNGGAQRGHSILTKDGSMTFQHFGSGTYFGADNYYSRYYILNPMWFIREYNSLIHKPEHIYRDKYCRWSTPYDSMANLITEEQLKRHASCGMGIWNTIYRSDHMPICTLDEFITSERPESFLENVRSYYEKRIDIPDNWKNIWSSPNIMTNFISDCRFLVEHTKVIELKKIAGYDEFIFENGQGLLLTDTRKDTPDTTPSNTGIWNGISIARELHIEDITAHYVTRPYLTRHGDGEICTGERSRQFISKDIQEDRTNHYNEHQGSFRYGKLDIPELKKRITEDISDDVKCVLEVTHCDEMDRISEFKKEFSDVNSYDTPLI